MGIQTLLVIQRKAKARKRAKQLIDEYGLRPYRLMSQVESSFCLSICDGALRVEGSTMLPRWSLHGQRSTAQLGNCCT